MKHFGTFVWHRIMSIDSGKVSSGYRSASTAIDADGSPSVLRIPRRWGSRAPCRRLLCARFSDSHLSAAPKNPFLERNRVSTGRPICSWTDRWEDDNTPLRRHARRLFTVHRCLSRTHGPVHCLSMNSTCPRSARPRVPRDEGDGSCSVAHVHPLKNVTPGRHWISSLYFNIVLLEESDRFLAGLSSSIANRTSIGSVRLIGVEETRTAGDRSLL